LAGLYGLHRLALWLESRGWLYYMHKKASPDSLGNAMLSLQQIVQPGAKHVLEVRREHRVQREDAGGPDEAGKENLGGK
jgi:hypothetical protein